MNITKIIQILSEALDAKDWDVVKEMLEDLIYEEENPIKEYEKDSDDIVHLQKVYLTSLDQVVFDIEITGVNQVIDMAVGNNYVHLLYDNTSTYIGQSYQLSAPSFNRIDYIRDSSFTTEAPVSLAFSSVGNNNYFAVLYPGTSSATNAIVALYDDGGDFDIAVAVRIDDISIVDASSIVADFDEEFWIVTHTNPVKLIRMFYESGAQWKFMFTNMDGT